MDHQPNQVPPLSEVGLRPERTGTGVQHDALLSLEGVGAVAVASAHGPVLTGDAIHEAFTIVRDLAGKRIISAPGQEVLDALVAAQRAA